MQNTDRFNAKHRPFQYHPSSQRYFYRKTLTRWRKTSQHTVTQAITPRQHHNSADAKGMTAVTALRQHSAAARRGIALKLRPLAPHCDSASAKHHYFNVFLPLEITMPFTLPLAGMPETRYDGASDAASTTTGAMPAISKNSSIGITGVA